MNRIRKILLLTVLIPMTAFSSASDDWLWEKSAKPLDIESSSSRTVVVCTADGGCRTVIIYGD